MRGVYTSGISISSLSAAKTLLYITAASTHVIEVLTSFIGNSGSNVTNQQLKALWQRITTLGTPTGTSITPTPTERGDQAAGGDRRGQCDGQRADVRLGPDAGPARLSDAGRIRPQFSAGDAVLIRPSDSWGLRMISTPTAFDAEVEVQHREIG
jgi:hypothetical protein